MKSLASAFVAFACVLAQAQQFPAPPITQPPSETDLKAAYCFGLAKQLGQSMEPQMARLRGYLIPRFPFIDPDGLLLASRQAEIDIAADIQAITNCKGRCNSSGSMQAKLRRCSELDFLPY